jgi:hypothetical protein
VRSGEGLLVRIFNPSTEPVTARLPGRAGWIVDLRGRPIRPFEDAVPLGPSQIATVRI